MDLLRSVTGTLPSHPALVPTPGASGAKAAAGQSSISSAPGGLTAAGSPKAASVRAGQLPGAVSAATDPLHRAYTAEANGPRTGATRPLEETLQHLIDRMMAVHGVAFSPKAKPADLIDLAPDPLDDPDLQRKSLLRALVRSGRMPVGEQVALMHHAIAAKADVDLVRQLHEDIGLPVKSLWSDQGPALPPFEKLAVSPFEAAATVGDHDVIAYLHARMKDFFAGREAPARGLLRRLVDPPPGPTDVLLSAAGKAAERGLVDVVSQLAAFEGAARPAASKVGALAIFEGVRNSRTSFVQALLERGFRPQTQPALQAAAITGNVELVRTLLQHDETKRQDRSASVESADQMLLQTPASGAKQDYRDIIELINKDRQANPKRLAANVGRYLGLRI